MKNTFILFILFFSSYLLTGQEKEHEPLLQTPSNWGSEFFTLPTGFAREMTFEGYEEATFPKGWRTVESPQFWSYVFAWSVTATRPLNIVDFENNLDLYFDGLMGGKQEPDGDPLLPTTTLVLKEGETGNHSSFVGKIRVFEGFRTKKMITLHLQIDQQFCEAQQKSMVVFRFSPKTFDDPIWKDLKSIIAVEEGCN